MRRVGAESDEWREQVEPHFGFLENRGYMLVRTDERSPWETVVVYESPVNAVLVKRSAEFGRVEVELARLDELGELPPVEAWVSAAPSGRALLDNVLAVRELKRGRWKRLKGIGRAATTRSLIFWGSALREVCPDFLDGSDACLAEAHALVWDRVQKKPEVMTVHLPSTATAAEEAAAWRRRELQRLRTSRLSCRDTAVPGTGSDTSPTDSAFKPPCAPERLHWRDSVLDPTATRSVMDELPPSDHVREIVTGFLQSQGLLPSVDVSYQRTLQGEQVISINPRAEGAAELAVQTAGSTGRYVVYVFVAGEARPIEIAGPINKNTGPPFRTAAEDLLETLHLVATGQVFDEVDEDGHVLRTDVPDQHTALGFTEGAERRWYKSWT